MAQTNPVAHVLLESPLPRLDRPFDYLVPATLDVAVRQGVKVRLRFGRRKALGWVLGRSPDTEHQGRLQPIAGIADPHPAFNDDTLRFFRAVAEHYAGSLADVLRLAVPPRAGADAVPVPQALPILAQTSVDRLQPGPGRWIWTCPPTHDWSHWFAGTLAATAAEGGRALAVVPDGRDVQRVATALARLIPSSAFAVLTGNQPPAERYRNYKAVGEGLVPVVIGTRSAALAPLPSPDLLLMWDDTDESHAEQRAPYLHAREVLAIRSQQSPGTFVVGSYSRSASAARWIDLGWASPLGPPRAEVRALAPVVQATDDDHRAGTPGDRTGRLPAVAGSVIRAALDSGPVLVCVGRRGYIPRLRCADCGTPSACPSCGTPLLVTSAGAAPQCPKCGSKAGPCPECGGDNYRWAAVGIRRTAEELGRAFPATQIVTSVAPHVLDEVPDRPAIVIATSGAEPLAAGGYAASVVLDVGEALSVTSIRGGEMAAHRWFAVGGLLRARAPMVMVADPGLQVVQALIRWDPAWLAAQELAQRREAGMAPARRVLAVRGDAEALAAVVAVLPAHVVIHGPTPDKDQQVVHLVMDHRSGGAVVRSMRELAVRRSVAGDSPIVVRVDPDL